ncbi:MAG: DUF4160 domain-containing protein [Salinivirgaceae bacterium]|nr:DUF4160 domain-containing protein [Salinivirgaceae bacterium]MDD4747374.1 DUF4160 domain-containing protein [Salinivirgaceae bacterium]
MPTILIIGKYRFFFNSREELRMHIHVSTSDGTAKFWLEPLLGLSDYYNLSTKELKEISEIIKEHQNEFIKAWEKHFRQ